MIKKLDHITINTNDIETTRHFYKEILGFLEQPVTDCGNHRYFFFKIDDYTVLEVGEYDFDDSIANSSSTASGKIRHIAFEVDDIFALKERLESAGFFFSTDIAYRGDELGFTSGQLLDPNGIELEFLEYGNAEIR